MATKNKTCLTCGTKFSFCPNCSGADKLAPSWHAEFCSEDCMQIWTTATKYNMGKLTKPEAKAIISELTLKSIDSYTKCVQRDLSVILAEEPKPKRGKRRELPVFDEAVPEEVKPALNEAIENIIDNQMVVETESVIVDNTHEVVIETIENE